MLTVLNVIRKNGRLSADYFYDDPNDVGTITLDLKTGTVLEKKYNGADESTDGIYTFPKALKLLRRMIELQKFPEKATYMWY